jgi:hypothetical protein
MGVEYLRYKYVTLLDGSGGRRSDERDESSSSSGDSSELHRDGVGVVSEEGRKARVRGREEVGGSNEPMESKTRSLPDLYSLGHSGPSSWGPILTPDRKLRAVRHSPLPNPTRPALPSLFRVNQMCLPGSARSVQAAVPYYP